MSKNYVSLKFILITIIVLNFDDKPILCRELEYSNSVNDCYHLCFYVETCIRQCQMGFSSHSKDYKSQSVMRSPRTRSGVEDNLDTSSGDEKKEAKSFSNDQSVFSSPPDCGLRYSSRTNSRTRSRYTGYGMARIVGGEDAELNEFPWLVSLQLNKEGKPLKHFCGASILNEYYILTAAHCTDSLVGKEHSVVIKAGIYNVDDTAQTIIPDKFIVHEEWNADNQINDISLIRVKSPIKYSINNHQKYTVNAICLDEPMTDPRGYCVLAGWGQLGENKANAEWLQKITLPLWDRDKCAVKYNEYMRIQETHICAGGKGGQDSCMGDSGGPLIQTRGPRSYQIGLVSFGIPCAVKGLPGVYTRLSLFSDWIREHIV